MDTIEATCFDVSGPFATFRVPATTRGYVTFPLIPRTAALGLLGSILGVDRNEAYRDGHFLKDAKIALQCLGQPKMMGFRTNLIHTKYLLSIGKLILYLPGKLDRGYRSPQTELYLVNPRYRLFVHLDDEEKQEELDRRLREKESHYIPYLGRANMLCFPEHVGKVTLKASGSKQAELCTVAEVKDGDEIHGDNFSILFSVPMNFSIEKSKKAIVLKTSRVANLAYFYLDPSAQAEDLKLIEIKSNEGTFYTIEEAPDALSPFVGKQVAFLPS